jgi:AraC family transcriptional activator of pobA
MLAIMDVHQDNGADWYEEGEGRKLSFHLSLVTYGKCVYWVNEEKVI